MKTLLKGGIVVSGGGSAQLDVLVDGEKPALPEDTRSTFINDEQEVIAQYPGVVELD